MKKNTAILFAIFSLASVLSFACKEVKTACNVIDATQGACNVLRYVDANGLVHETPIQPEEMKRLTNGVSGIAPAASASGSGCAKQVPK